MIARRLYPGPGHGAFASRTTKDWGLTFLLRGLPQHRFGLITTRTSEKEGIGEGGRRRRRVEKGRVGEEGRDGNGGETTIQGREGDSALAAERNFQQRGMVESCYFLLNPWGYLQVIGGDPLADCSSWLDRDAGALK